MSSVCNHSRSRSRFTMDHTHTFFLLLLGLVFVFIPAVLTEPIFLNLDTPAVFEDYGFSCIVRDVSSESCQLKAAASASELPDYFPPRFRNLEWLPGSYMFYVEGNGTGS